MRQTVPLKRSPSPLVSFLSLISSINIVFISFSSFLLHFSFFLCLIFLFLFLVVSSCILIFQSTSSLFPLLIFFPIYLFTACSLSHTFICSFFCLICSYSSIYFAPAFHLLLSSINLSRRLFYLIFPTCVFGYTLSSHLDFLLLSFFFPSLLLIIIHLISTPHL